MAGGTPEKMFAGPETMEFPRSKPTSTRAKHFSPPWLIGRRGETSSGPSGLQTSSSRDESAAARRLLESEGFKVSDIIDIFDGGPCLEAQLPEIRAIKESREAAVQIVAEEDCVGRFLVANPSLDGFRVGQGPVKELAAGKVGIPEKMAAGLNVKAGENVRYVTLKRNS